MKKLLSIIIVLVFLLVGCSEDNKKCKRLSITKRIGRPTTKCLAHRGCPKMRIGRKGPMMRQRGLHKGLRGPHGQGRGIGSRRMGKGRGVGRKENK